MRKIMRFGALVLGCAATTAWGSYGTFTWCGEGANNKWSTKANWVGGVVPGSWDYVFFPAGTNWVVEVTSAVSPLGIQMPDGEGSLTLSGTVSISCPAFGGDSSHPLPSQVNVGAGRCLIVDGVAITPYQYLQRGEVVIKNGGVINVTRGYRRWIYGDAKLTLENGDFKTDDTEYLYVSNRAEVVVQNGTFENFKGVYFNDNTHYLQTGGRYVAHYAYYTVYRFYNPCTVDILGGTVQWIDQNGSAATIETREFLKVCPQRGAQLIFPNKNESAAKFGGTTSATVGGEIYVTNRTSATSGGFTVASYAGVCGGGDLYANVLNVNPPANEGSSEWNLGKLALGAGGIVHNDHSSVNYHFRDGTAFGAFADWSFFNGPAQSFYFNLHGPLVFDTLNCFGDTNETGKVLSHTISGGHVKLATTTDFKAEGGGTVDLTPEDSPAQLRTLEVAANTTVCFTNKLLKLKAMNIKMGADATLAIDVSQGSYVDASSTASFGAGSKIVVTAIPATLTEGKRYPIYMGPAKKGGLAAADFPSITFANALPDGWSLGIAANSAFLTDGKAYAVSYSEKDTGWTGEGADNALSTGANWSTGKAPAVNAHLKLYGTAKPTVAVTAAFNAGSINLSSASGPYAFSGESMRFRYPNSSSGWENIFYSVRADGAFPFVLENDLGASVSNTLGLWFEAFNQGSIAVLGNSLDTIPLHFGGDVRLGGAYTATTLACTPNYGNSYVTRRSSLTVMPGATLTVTAQAGSQHYDGGATTPKATDFYYAVATNGAMTVGGTDFTFTRAATHFVDGALTVTCPFVTSALQTFRGDGTLQLDDARGNAADFAGGLRLEGNLTFVPDAISDNLTIFVKDNVTFAPTADWTYANTTNLVLDGHSKLTLATGGHKVTFASPIVSGGEVAVTGGGRLVLGAAGTSLWKLACADGATVGATDAVLEAGAGADKYADILAVRRQDDSLAFAGDLKIKMRYDVYTDRYIFSAKRKPGLAVIIR